jgi:hypothetical protein
LDGSTTTVLMPRVEVKSIAPGATAVSVIIVEIRVQ